ncbi:methyltransferase domain-containing protein [Granulicella sp. L46]|uniref:methyltransferase domain-containing protein n=1 Tax=Granulicella sp. L46 TaxID=1641865 RepID=UPI00131DB691|nr:methyltransferase domain-containing protein [Granulicella sp. L46]
MVYLENPPASEALEDELAWEKTFANESKERRKRSPLLYMAGRAPKAAVQRVTKRNKLLDFVTKNIKPGPILDIGCAGGHTLASLPETYIPFGIEISHELSQVAASAFGPRGGAVIQADALAGLAQMPRNEFNGIIMTSFLEHDTKAKETLLAVRRVMREDARLIVKVPNYASWNRRVRGSRWCGFRFPDHVNYFTPDTLTQMLSKAGLGIVRFGILDRLPTSDTMWLIARKAH